MSIAQACSVLSIKGMSKGTWSGLLFDDTRPGKMVEICGSVIVLKDPRDLPWAMALLIPRAIVA
jgi:hypothetical protein